MTKKEEPELGPRKVTDKEMSVAWSGPALNANRFFVNVGANVRIAFCEEANPELGPQFRSAVIMHPQDAIALKDVLVRILGPIEAQVKELNEGQQKQASKDV